MEVDPNYPDDEVEQGVEYLPEIEPKPKKPRKPLTEAQKKARMKNMMKARRVRAENLAKKRMGIREPTYEDEDESGSDSDEEPVFELKPKKGGKKKPKPDDIAQMKQMMSFLMKNQMKATKEVKRMKRRPVPQAPPVQVYNTAPPAAPKERNEQAQYQMNDLLRLLKH